MNQRFRILMSALLLAAFALFNVGVPAVQYLCPMMSSDNPVCAMMPSDSGAGPAITNIIPSCCSKYIVAERNTTPFLKIHDVLSHTDAVASTPPLFFAAAVSAEQFLATPRAEVLSPPLFILHSSLLI